MFGAFKKVSQDEQDDLVGLCDEVFTRTLELQDSLLGRVPQAELVALQRYKRAAMEISRNWNSWDPQSTTMPRILYNKALKEMSAARHVLSRLDPQAQQTSVLQRPEVESEMSDPAEVEELLEFAELVLKKGDELKEVPNAAVADLEIWSVLIEYGVNVNKLRSSVRDDSGTTKPMPRVQLQMYKEAIAKVAFAIHYVEKKAQALQ